MNNIKNNASAVAAITISIIALCSNMALAESQWEMAVKNLGGGGFWKAYTSLASCEADHVGGGKCLMSMRNCGTYGLNVYVKKSVGVSITDADYGPTIAFYDMNGDDIGNELCRGDFR